MRHVTKAMTVHEVDKLNGQKFFSEENQQFFGDRPHCFGTKLWNRKLVLYRRKASTVRGSKGPQTVKSNPLLQTAYYVFDDGDILRMSDAEAEQFFSYREMSNEEDGVLGAVQPALV